MKVLLALLLLLAFTISVEASACSATSHAEFTLQFDHYWNPDERNYNGGKCDDFSACEYYFIICLNTQTSTDPCTIGSFTTKYWERSQNVSFSIGEVMNSTSQTNPLNFTIQSYT
ncbi:uncharacterized protein TRIADDRAFT_62665, partial [Trichoplax adhaerens]